MKNISNEYELEKKKLFDELIQKLNEIDNRHFINISKDYVFDETKQLEKRKVTHEFNEKLRELSRKYGVTLKKADINIFKS